MKGEFLPNVEKTLGFFRKGGFWLELSPKIWFIDHWGGYVICQLSARHVPGHLNSILYAAIYPWSPREKNSSYLNENKKYLPLQNSDYSYGNNGEGRMVIDGR